MGACWCDLRLTVSGSRAGLRPAQSGKSRGPGNLAPGSGDCRRRCRCRGSPTEGSGQRGQSADDDYTEAGMERVGGAVFLGSGPGDAACRTVSNPVVPCRPVHRGEERCQSGSGFHHRGVQRLTDGRDSSERAPPAPLSRRCVWRWQDCDADVAPPAETGSPNSAWSSPTFGPSLSYSIGGPTGAIYVGDVQVSD